jgi:hypothetical protein
MNRLGPKAKGPIIQHGECPGCGAPAKFDPGKAGRFRPGDRALVDRPEGAGIRFEIQDARLRDLAADEVE